ncbi:hypothetical protein [Halosegnis marinus]|uniref:Small CPxCG-related zinc finger protein n=1 Tax=Halosegnis marinus TaxID=3034023 RepID=A0ABD5ZRW5_9EURY|nr:hypothetical protein [Halosegnis sp. DT85]
MERRCPDCGVTMEPITLKSNGGYELQAVSDENRGGILGSLGMKERLDLETVACPECGLVRLYAGAEE